VTSETIVEFDKNIASDKKDLQFLEFIGKGTRPNQLFLTETRERGVKQFKEVVDWFANSLNIIFPDSTYRDLELELDSDKNVQKAFALFLDLFDTGIADIGFKTAEYKEIPEALRNDIEQDLNEGKLVSLRSPKGRYVVKKDSRGDIEASRMVTKHRLVDSNKLTDLEIEYESDGTQRLLDLIPVIFELTGGDRVFLIDELDRSFHPALSYKMMQYFLEQVSGTSSQLIVTTHESNLLDLDLLRRDEIWFVEKDHNGASKLYSLEEFAPRYDKDIRKGYLQGRFGSIPILGESAGLNIGEGEKDAGKA
jgi:AAA15 family ATPase/GTPase